MEEGYDAKKAAAYRAGHIDLAAQFHPWPEQLQKACETAALYGVLITPEEAEAAIEVLFEINPRDCWNLLCCDFEPEDHVALIRGILSDRYPQCRFSPKDAVFLLGQLKHMHKTGFLPWVQIEDVIALYLSLS